MIYSINYDLKKPGQNYTNLHKAIKDCGDWWHYLDSTWLVDTTLTANGIWQRLKPHTDNSDFVLVISVSEDYEGCLPREAWDWIKSRLAKRAA